MTIIARSGADFYLSPWFSLALVRALVRPLAILGGESAFPGSPIGDPTRALKLILVIRPRSRRL